MSRFKDQAVCIRYLDWSETSQIVVLLAKEHGKVCGLAKGSKRASPSAVARYSGGIELLTLGQIVATVRPSSELATLTEWDLQKPYAHLRRDLGAQRIAMYCADLTDSFIADYDPHQTVFDGLCTLLVDLKQSEGRTAALLRYQWLLLDAVGHRPQLDRDVRLNAPLTDHPIYSFDPRAGGFTVQVHNGTAPANTFSAGPWRVRRNTLEILRAVADNWLAEQSNQSQSIDRANRLLCVYARSLLDRQLPTMALILDT